MWRRHNGRAQHRRRLRQRTLLLCGELPAMLAGCVCRYLYVFFAVLIAYEVYMCILHICAARIVLRPGRACAYMCDWCAAMHNISFLEYFKVVTSRNFAIARAHASVCVCVSVDDVLPHSPVFNSIVFADARSNLNVYTPPRGVYTAYAIITFGWVFYTNNNEHIYYISLSKQ